MDFEDWEPIYRRIVADFGFDSTADRRARDRLLELVPDDVVVSLDSLNWSEQTIVIVGAAGTSPDAGDTDTVIDLETVRGADHTVAASDGATVLLDHGLAPDMLVTDLDGTPETVLQLARDGVPIAVHAHGDNIDRLNEFVPKICGDASQHNHGIILPTTQVEPLDPPYNVGGFTDGDRAAFLADACGAGRLEFCNWDLDDRSVRPEKQRKLTWAARLLHLLEVRRGERFSLLNGRRHTLDIEAFKKS